MNRENAKEITYFPVYVKGTLFGFTDVRVDRTSVPAGMYMYEVRGTEDGSEPCEIVENILVNFFGTIIGKYPIPEYKNGPMAIRFSDIPEYYFDEDGAITEEKTEYPHYCPLYEDWDLDFGETELSFVEFFS